MDEFSLTEKVLDDELIAYYKRIVECWYSAGWKNPWKIRSAIIWYRDSNGKYLELQPKQLGIKKKNQSMFAILSPFIVRDLENSGYSDVSYEAYLQAESDVS